MKKYLIITSILGAAGVSLIGIQSASAHMGGGGMFGFGFSNTSITPDQIAERQQAMFQEQATILGLTVDEVKNAWADGKSMKNIMAEKNISAEQVQIKIKEARLIQVKTQLKTLVEKGVITQAQADKRTKVAETQTQNFKSKKMGRMMKGW